MCIRPYWTEDDDEGGDEEVERISRFQVDLNGKKDRNSLSVVVCYVYDCPTLIRYQYSQYI